MSRFHKEIYAGSSQTRKCRGFPSYVGKPQSSQKRLEKTGWSGEGKRDADAAVAADDDLRGLHGIKTPNAVHLAHDTHGRQPNSVYQALYGRNVWNNSAVRESRGRSHVICRLQRLHRLPVATTDGKMRGNGRKWHHLKGGGK